MEGTGEKARNHRHFCKFVIFPFFAFFGYCATIHPTWKTDFWPKKGKNGGGIVWLKGKKMQKPLPSLRKIG